MFFNRFFRRKDLAIANPSPCRGNKNNCQPRRMSLEALESRELLTVTTGVIDDVAYDEIRASYPKFDLPELQADLNVMTITPDDGALSITDLQEAIATAGTTALPDLILVQTSANANSVTYAISDFELEIDINSTEFGSVTIIGWGEEKFTLDANQQSRVMSISGGNTVVNLGGLKITNGYADGGAGIANSQSSLTIANSTISNNCADSSIGGGIANAFGAISIINSEIVGNTSIRGAGILNTGTLMITNATIAGNVSEGAEYSDGGGICHLYGTIEVYNSVIAFNSAVNGTDIYSFTPSINGFNNLSSYTSWQGVGNKEYNSELPLFIAAPLGDYRLAQNSQAINQGSNQYANEAGLNELSTDVTGAARILGSTIDMGAHEYHEISAPSVPALSLIVSSPDSITVNIEAVEYASGYVLEYSTRVDFINATSQNVSSGSTTITDLSDETTYYFRVKSISEFYGNSDFSAAVSATTPPVDAVENYNINDFSKLRAFLEQTNSSDIKNGLLINANYRSSDPATWTGVTWEEIDGTMSVTQIDWAQEDLELSGNLDVSGCSALQTLNCSNNQLTSLDASDCPSLQTLACDDNQLIALNVFGCSALEYLNCSSNQLTSLDVSRNVALTELNCYYNELVLLDVSNNAALTTLNCHANKLASLDVSNNAALTTLNCHANKLTSLDVSNNAELTTLECQSNQISSLDVTNNAALRTLNCSLCDLSSLDVSNCVSLEDLDCSQNQISVLNLTNNNALTLVYCFDGAITNIIVSSERSKDISFLSLNSQGWTLSDTNGSALETGNTITPSTALPVYASNQDNSKIIVIEAALSVPSMSVEVFAYDTIAVVVEEVGSADGYLVEYSTSEDFSNAISQIVSAGLTAITGLNPQTTYYFRVRATSESCIDSDYSAVATATTPAAPIVPEVNARVVFRDSQTNVDTSSSLPEGIASIRAGKTVYAEIWIKDIKDSDPAIIGGYMNMLYDNNALSVGDVTYGSVFSTLTSNPDVSTAGLIDLIGGGAAQGVLNMGDDEWVRLATVSFVADTEGVTTVSLGAPNDYHDNITRVGGVILTNDQIDFGSAELEITAACPMDIDGDGYIGMSDYGLLSNAWRSSPGKSNWNPACDIDGDGYVGMSDYAFLSNNWRKYTDDPSLIYPTAVASPAAAFSSEIIVDPYNPIAYSDNAIADVRLTAVSTKTASDTADEVPASLTEINPGDSFFVEIWVRNFNGYEGANLCGLFGGYVNMSYPSNLLAVGDVTYSSIFPQFNGMQDVSVPGVIDLIGGATAMGVKDKGDDEWVRLATIEFTATATGDVQIESLPPTNSGDNLTLATNTGRLLNNDEIDYGALNLTIADNATQLAAPSLTAYPTSSNSVSVTVGSVEHASRFLLEYSTNSDFRGRSVKSISVYAGSTVISDLNPETTYYFRAMSLGTGDYSNSDYSAVATATTPPAPVLEAEVNARVVFQDSLKDVDTAAELPEGISSIRATKTVYAEIWVKDVENTDPAIIGGYLNMLYDSDALSVLDVTYGTEFCYMTGFQTYENGEIATIGGVTAPSVLNKGDDEWVRLATVSFVADMEGFTTVSLGAPNDYHDNMTRTDGIILANEQIDYGSSVLEVTAACPMDIDGDGYIGVSDYSLLSKAWRSSPGKENWDPACDIDGDGYVGVSDYTFLSINWRKYADDPDLTFPDAVASPAAPVSENVVIASPAAVVSEDNFIEMSNTAALEADETANVLLTAVSTKTASDTADEVPSSLTEINPGDSFFVEIWVRNFNGYEGANLCGLTGGYLNMSYPEELLNLGDVTYGRVFSQLNNFQDVSQAGFIDLIGGVAGAGVLDKGDNEWVRLATVSFTASENGDALIESLPPTDSHDNLTLTSGKTLKNDEISFGVINLRIGSTVIQLKVNNDFIKTTLNNSVVIAYRENDAVADWSKTTVEFGDASNGEYSVNANGTITYTPEDGFYGTDAFPTL